MNFRRKSVIFCCKRYTLSIIVRHDQVKFLWKATGILNIVLEIGIFTAKVLYLVMLLNSCKQTIFKRIFGVFLFICSGVEHQKADWVGIHEKICQSLIALRQAAPFLPSEEERQKRERHVLVKKVTMYKMYFSFQIGNFLKV